MEGLLECTQLTYVHELASGWEDRAVSSGFLVREAGSHETGTDSTKLFIYYSDRVTYGYYAFTTTSLRAGYDTATGLLRYYYGSVTILLRANVR